MNTFITLRAKLSSAVYCNRARLFAVMLSLGLGLGLRPENAGLGLGLGLDLDVI